MSLKPYFLLSSFAIVSALVIFAVDRLSTQSDLGQIITAIFVMLTLRIYSGLINRKDDDASALL
ncbi:MAG TPA: hypothetical protein PKX07_01275 [Aggregatilineales bacterium]|jgi:hypothetical protein|nr:hypothetical protein [Aggregatilineales bacterium]